MKTLILLAVILLAVSVIEAEPIETDKGIHFTGELGLYLFTDLVLEIAGLDGWYNVIPIGLALSVGFGKELFMDDIFSWEDIAFDCSGICVGFLLRIP